jgi:hypothetical protein
MYKRGCWNEEKEEKWTKDSQKMVCFLFNFLFFSLIRYVHLFR